MKKVVYLCVTMLVAIAIVLCFIVKDKYDPYFKEQWSLNEASQCNGIDAKKMWNLLHKTEQKKEITIAVLDTGIDFNNRELSGNEWINKNEIPDNGKDDDENGYVDDYNGFSFIDNNGIANNLTSYHGTVCAEIIAANHNKNGMEGIVGNKIKVKLMDLKVSSSNSYGEKGTISDVIEAVEYAELMGADICNMSFSFDYDNEKLKSVMSNSNMLFIVAAGNNYSGWKIDIDKKKKYPAAYNLSNMIVVTSSNSKGELDGTANYGKGTVDLAAPGIDIVAVDENNKKEYYSGTSFAVACVTGVASIIYAINDELEPYQIKELICNSIIKKNNLTGKCRTGGILNGKNAILNTLELSERK